MMTSGFRVPSHLVTDAFRTTARKLRAKTTRFFAHEGEVISQRMIDDNDAQLRAADQVYQLAGLYPSKQDRGGGGLTVAIEVDPTTGVIRLVAGSAQNTDSVPSPRSRALPVRSSAGDGETTTRRGRKRVPEAK